MTKHSKWRKALLYLTAYSHSGRTGRAGDQGGTLEARTETESVEGCCLLANWLASRGLLPYTVQDHLPLGTTTYSGPSPLSANPMETFSQLTFPLLR